MKEYLRVTYIFKCIYSLESTAFTLQCTWKIKCWQIKDTLKRLLQTCFAKVKFPQMPQTLRSVHSFIESKFRKRWKLLRYLRQHLSRLGQFLHCILLCTEARVWLEDWSRGTLHYWYHFRSCFCSFVPCAAGGLPPPRLLTRLSKWSPFPQDFCSWGWSVPAGGESNGPVDRQHLPPSEGVRIFKEQQDQIFIYPKIMWSTHLPRLLPWSSLIASSSTLKGKPRGIWVWIEDGGFCIAHWPVIIQVLPRDNWVCHGQHLCGDEGHHLITSLPKKQLMK